MSSKRKAARASAHERQAKHHVRGHSYQPNERDRVSVAGYAPQGPARRGIVTEVQGKLVQVRGVRWEGAAQALTFSYGSASASPTLTN